ncbi:hypothetical protein GCM10011363_45950 [Marivita lacus]|uniref:Uncharacterized protein n=1 Tax=Marivita lacus TaxID=1323742 RepID=A0ABQ1LGE0_9RHOB|nr:hypothetical protein [Marivita lacus]GGC24230.1 hypothetical protein GCM10011363_45950 [Marivita lacus]
MTDRTYPRPTTDLDALLDALAEAGADRGIVGTGLPDTIGCSIESATPAEIDSVYESALRETLTRRQDGQFIKNRGGSASDSGNDSSKAR